MHKYCKHTVYNNFQVTSFSQNLIPKNQKMNSLSTIEILGLCIDYVNRHLYFTNMGWYSSTSPYHQVEMVDLRDAGKRKVLTSSLLEKPRDILIDLHYGWEKGAFLERNTHAPIFKKKITRNARKMRTHMRFYLRCSLTDMEFKCTLIRSFKSTKYRIYSYLPAMLQYMSIGKDCIPFIS